MNEAQASDHRGAIRALGGPKACEQEAGLPHKLVKVWASRNSIPPEHWPAFEALAERKGVDWIKGPALKRAYDIRWGRSAANDARDTSERVAS